MEFLNEIKLPEYHYPAVLDGIKWKPARRTVNEDLPFILPVYTPRKHEIIYSIKIVVNNTGRRRVMVDGPDYMPDVLRKIIKAGLYFKQYTGPIIVTDIQSAYSSVNMNDLHRVTGVLPQPCVLYQGVTYRWTRGLLPGHADSYRLFARYLAHYLVNYKHDFITAVEQCLPPGMKLNYGKTRVIRQLDTFMGYTFATSPIERICTVLSRNNMHVNPRAVWLGNLCVYIRRIITLYWYINRTWYNQIIAELKKYDWIYNADLYVIDLSRLPVIMGGTVTAMY